MVNSTVSVFSTALLFVRLSKIEIGGGSERAGIMFLKIENSLVRLCGGSISDLCVKTMGTEFL